MLNGFYVLMAIAVATVPGWAIRMFTAADPLAVVIVGTMLFLILFPFVLLSMLEISSPWAIFSPRVFGSLWRAPVAWFFFTMESFLLVAVLAFGNFWIYQFNPWLVPLITPIVVAGSFVYFRLLGRLGWCLAQTLRSK
ncbi:MAG: hypothetical protein JW829_17015 [Pirellulales bacterium]|nr:hypothetical protein [Pirellulales bacterium]